MAFNEQIEIAGLRPASYNPRHIADDVLADLRSSIENLGFIKPIVARTDGLLIAGHQRTTAAKALGMTHVPGHVIEIRNEADEIRFNQLHNGCEIDICEEQCRIPPGKAGTWSTTKDIEIPARMASGAAERNEMLPLLAKYGPFAGCVSLPHGEVVAGQMYAWCCKRLGIPVHVRYVERSAGPGVRKMLGRTYGEYSYRNLPRTTWAQSLAQLNRLEGEAQLKSSLYEMVVLPTIGKADRILDFGCGRGAYVRRLQELGYKAFGIEFYERKGFSINVQLVNRKIDRLLHEIAKNGRFDVVICDSVLNSVDSPKAEADVMACLNAFCKPGGRIMFSGRPLEYIEGAARRQNFHDRRRYIEFLDDQGFTAIYRNGEWHYQKFHNREQVDHLASMYLGPEYRVTSSNKASVPKAHLTGSSWQVSGTKSIELDQAVQESAIGSEFDLPLPGGKSYGRSADAIAAFRKALTLEGSK